MTTLTDDYRADTSTTASLTIGGALQAALELPNDKDWIKVELQAGHTYLFDLSGSASGGGTLMPYGGVLTLYNQIGGFLDTAFSNGPGGDPRLSYTPATTGSYFLQAGEITGGTGSYTMKASDTGTRTDDYATGITTSGVVPIGGRASGILELPNDRDWFKVMLEAGKTYVFDLSTAGSGGGNMLAGLGALTLYDAIGGYLDTSFTNGPGGDPRMSYTPQHSGAHFLQAHSLMLGTGTYAMQAWQPGAVKGGAGNDLLGGLASNDALTGAGGDDWLEGAGGVDTAVYLGASGNFRVTRTASALIVADQTGSEGSDTLTGIERLRFSDMAYALDVDGTAGRAYRLYQAAFDRAPDKSGLGFWIAALDGGTSMLNVAAGFTSSPEFETLYGKNASNAVVITALYANVLHRAPDQEGYAFWLDALDTRKATLPSILADFSESAENREALAVVIGDGFAYTPFG